MSIYVHIEEITAGFYILHVHSPEIFNHALAEVIPVFVCVQCPTGFGNSYCAREGLIVAVIVARHVFGPNVALYSDDVFFYQVVCIVRYRVITVGFFKCIISADSNGGYLRFFLILIQISVWIRSHNSVVTGFGCIHSAFYSPPGHDGSIRGQPALQDFVPPDDVASFAVQVFLHAGNEVTL